MTKSAIKIIKDTLAEHPKRYPDYPLPPLKKIKFGRFLGCGQYTFIFEWFDKGRDKKLKIHSVITVKEITESNDPRYTVSRNLHQISIEYQKYVCN
jgi:hypothetical protein